MKKSLRRFIAVLTAIGMITVISNSCKKEENSTPENSVDFNVRLAGGPNIRSTYDSVNIDIQKVSIHISADSSETSGWHELQTNDGIYNLLDFMVNDTLLAFDPLLHLQKVSQIRLILGDRNTIVDEGVEYELDTPSAQTSGLKVQVHADFQPNAKYIVLLEFDPDQSIVKTGNVKYKLKPVIQATVTQVYP